MSQIAFTFTGTTPLLLHNTRLANPLDPIVRAMKKITGKRKKTDEDLEELARLEFLGGLYYGESYDWLTPPKDKMGPHIPGEMLDACLRDGAKPTKQGRHVQRGAMVVEPRVKLEYEGPRDPAALWKAGTFRDMRMVKVMAAKVLRCRPKFPIGWHLSFTLEFADAMFNPEDLIAIAKTAGRYACIGDYRPRYGQFTVESKIL